MTHMKLGIVVLTGALTASCVVGPQYKRPVVRVPDVHRGATAGDTDSLADREWFDLFHDDTLTSLVTTALKQNFELRIAAERVLQARAVYGISRADRLPTVDATGSFNSARLSTEGANRAIPSGAKTAVTYTEAGFSLGWEL